MCFFKSGILTKGTVSTNQLISSHSRQLIYSVPPGGKGGGVLWEFLGGDVQLGPWNP